MSVKVPEKDKLELRSKVQSLSSGTEFDVKFPEADRIAVALKRAVAFIKDRIH